ncbi:winged helix-turn-helix domain-containing protein [Actinomadura madurae]|nr:winged helix-turn-helix domain-containing protein [Actinomadura madurae]
MLAVLLRHANTPVSDDLLADALWGDRPPRSAAANLRMYVHTLRRTLESADRIARVPPGYALTVRPGELDAQRFADLVRQGREAGERADAVAAHAALSEALGLWRGDAYAGLDDLPSLRDEAVRLEELRLAAVEDRVSAGPGPGPARRAGARAPRPGRRAPAPGTVPGAADARPLPLRPAGRSPAGLPRHPARAHGGAGHRARPPVAAAGGGRARQRPVTGPRRSGTGRPAARTARRGPPLSSCPRAWRGSPAGPRSSPG